jgi:hypothetical protein
MQPLVNIQIKYFWSVRVFHLPNAPPEFFFVLLLEKYWEILNLRDFLLITLRIVTLISIIYNIKYITYRKP